MPATNPQPLPVAARRSSSTSEIVGAGRTWSLAEFHVETASTSLLVLVHGELVHQWYREGLGPADVFLGASATKSLLSHLVGVAVRAGALELADLVGEHVPELAGSGYGRVPVGALVTMTSGVDWVEDHRDPVGPATALVSAFADGHLVAGGAGPGRHPLPRRAPASSTAPPIRRCWTGCGSGPPAMPFPEALQQLWAELGATADAAVAVDGDGVALAGGGVAAAAVGLGPDRAAADARRRCPTGGTCSTTTGSTRAPGRCCRSSSPGRLPSALSTHVGFGYHWWPLDELGARVSADGSRGQFVYLDRPSEVVVVKTSNWAYADPWHDRQCRDLSYLALATIADAARLPTREGVPQ